jgi:hypothetical protein
MQWTCMHAGLCVCLFTDGALEEGAHGGGHDGGAHHAQLQAPVK